MTQKLTSVSGGSELLVSCDNAFVYTAEGLGLHHYVVAPSKPGNVLTRMADKVHRSPIDTFGGRNMPFRLMVRLCRA
jgi:hypothetical protein